MTAPKPTPSAKGAAPAATPTDDPSVQLAAAQKKLDDLINMAQSTDKAKAEVTGRVKVLKERADFEKALPAFDAWTSDRTIRIASAQTKLNTVLTGNVAPVADKVDALAAAIAHEDENIAALAKTAADAAAEAAAKGQRLVDATAVLQTKQADVAKAQAALSAVDDQLKSFESLSSAAKAAADNKDLPGALLAIVDAKKAGGLTLPTRDAVIAALRAAWAALDVAQEAVDGATRDKAAAVQTAADLAARLKAAQQARQASALQVIKDALKPAST